MLVVSLCLLLTVLLVQSQDECPDIDASMVESLVRDSYNGSGNSSALTVEITEFNVVCRAAGPTQGMYRYLSLVATYSCSGSTDCEDTTVTAQFDTQCSSDVWEEQVSSFSNDKIRTVPADGDSGTAERTNCSLCLSPTLAAVFGLASDNETHCVGKLASYSFIIRFSHVAHLFPVLLLFLPYAFVFLCTDCTECLPSTGLGLCYSYLGFNQTCCNFYQNGTCVVSCTNGRVANAEFNCGELDCSVCTLVFLLLPSSLPQSQNCALFLLCM